MQLYLGIVRFPTRFVNNSLVTQSKIYVVCSKKFRAEGCRSLVPIWDSTVAYVVDIDDSHSCLKARTNENSDNPLPT